MLKTDEGDPNQELWIPTLKGQEIRRSQSREMWTEGEKSFGLWKRGGFVCPEGAALNTEQETTLTVASSWATPEPLQGGAEGAGELAGRKCSQHPHGTCFLNCSL